MTVALTVQTAAPEQTEALGRAIGSRLRGGDLVQLIGDLGGGKTTFVSGLAAGLGCTAEVASPTFVYVHEYPGPIPLAHIDLYRLEPGADLEPLGVSDYLGGAWVTVIEWADRAAAGQLPAADLVARFHATESGTRRIEFDAPPGRLERILSSPAQSTLETPHAN